MNKINIFVSHGKREKVQIVCGNAVKKMKKIGPYQSFLSLETPDNEIVISLQQYHRINSKFWWLILLCPVLFLQRFLLRYEREYIDDYFAGIKLDLRVNQNSSVYAKLNKVYSDSVSSKNFYPSFCRIQTQAPICRFEFNIDDIQNAELISAESQNNIFKNFIRKWRFVRLFPAVFTYTAIAGIFITYSVQNDVFSNSQSTMVLCVILFLLIVCLAVTFEKIMSFKPKFR